MTAAMPIPWHKSKSRTFVTERKEKVPSELQARFVRAVRAVQSRRLSPKEGVWHTGKVEDKGSWAALKQTPMYIATGHTCNYGSGYILKGKSCGDGGCLVRKFKICGSVRMRGAVRFGVP